jgi:predicted transglutaminase-like cysteine proteinase
MPIGAATYPPYGYVDLCVRDPVDCPAPRGGEANPTLTSYWREVFHGVPQGEPAVNMAGDEAGPRLHFSTDLERQLDRINQSVNKRIRPVSEGALDDVWSLPLAEGRRDGDCEDYVLEKRRVLIGEGLPAEALSIALVETRRDQPHAVLLVNTDNGEIVLDNHSPWATPWRAVNYVWLKRQSPYDQSRWVEVPHL